MKGFIYNCWKVIYHSIKYWQHGDDTSEIQSGCKLLSVASSAQTRWPLSHIVTQLSGDILTLRELLKSSTEPVGLALFFSSCKED